MYVRAYVREYNCPWIPRFCYPPPSLCLTLSLLLPILKYLQYSPSLLAAAIVYAARHALSVGPLWRPELEELTGHATSDVHGVFVQIWALYSETFPAHARRSQSSPKGVSEFDGAAVVAGI